MTQPLYDVVYRGKLLSGSDYDTVKSRLMGMFSLSEDKAAKILGSSGMILKKGLDEASARKLGMALKRIGMDVALAGSATVTAPGGRPQHAPAAEKDRTAMTPDGEQEAVPAEAEIREAPSRAPFEFAGSGSEYFKIWLVNMILSMLTLGIYSAWAKVRRKRYFYGNTKLLGGSFEYLADPKKILKGRLVVFGFFFLYSILSTYAPFVSGIMSLAFILILPWLIVRALMFNARNSAFRNIRFSFKGSVREAAKVYLLWPFLSLITLGALFPYSYFRQKQFVVQNTCYGRTPFVFAATAREYYRIYMSALVPILIGILLAAGAGYFFPPVSVLIVLVLYLYLMAYFSVKTTNLLFNAGSLSRHRFESGLKIGTYLALVVVNSLGIALTLGLLYPWAKVRTVRYKLDHLALLAAGDLDGFVAAEKEQVGAVGEEVGDFFDMDFGL